MCRGQDVYGWVRQLDSSPSTHRWSVEIYVTQDPHQGATVVFGYDYKLVGVGCNSMQVIHSVLIYGICV
jgi:hypothetical protein